MAAEHVRGANRRNALCKAARLGFSRALLPLLSLAVLCQAASVRDAHRTRSGAADGVGAARRRLQSKCPKGQNLIFGQCVDPCSGTVCPDVSVCSPVEGAPSCSCPAGFARLLNSKCSNAALPFAEYLDPHNAARAAVGAPPLTWSTTLAARAQRWANHLKANLNCDIEHGDTDGIGQNLAWSSGYSSYSGTDATNQWVAEGALYRYQVFDTSKNAAGCTTGNWGDCGHYTQVVWANTKEVGCGTVTCGQDRAYVCDYYPAGNFEGEFPYVKQQTTPGAKPPPPKTSAKSPPPPRKSSSPPPRKSSSPPPRKSPSPPPSKKGNPPPKPTKSPKSSPSKPPPPSPSSSSVSPQCQGVVCPSGASCRANTDKVPFCTCASGVSLVNNQCTRSTASPILATSVAIYSTTRTRPPFVARVPMDDGCVDLPSGIAGSIANFSVIWDATGTSLAPGAEKSICSTVWLWSDSGCYGNARGLENPDSEATSFEQANTFYRGAKSINCE